jgi:CRP-like cAMP-binding protein
MIPEYKKIARHSLILSNASDDLAEKLLAGARASTFSRGETIFLQGEPARAIFIVAEGWVKLYRIAPNGAEAVVGVFTKGRSFGEAVAFRSDVYPVAAEAVTDCTLIRLETDAFLRVLRSEPELMLAVLAATFAHLHGLVAQVEALKALTGDQRVAEFLLELCPCEDGACTVTLPYEKVLIAGRLGMKPESLSRAFARLREAGVTIRQNHAAISDIGTLRNFAEEDPAVAWSKAL